MKIISAKPAPPGMRNTFGWVSADLGNGVCVFGVKLCRREHGIFGYGDTPGRRVVTVHPELAGKLAVAAFGAEILK